MASAFPPEAVGAYADLGGEIAFTTVEWGPHRDEPRRVAASLLKLAGYLDNTAAPLRAAAAIARADIQHHFDTETDPNGHAWHALDPEYQVRKESIGADPGILKRFGELESAATDGSAFVVDGEDLFFSTAGLPEYWLWMQEGTGDPMNVGAHADYRSRVSAGVLGEDQRSHDSLGIGSGKATPARPFIGLSGEAEEQIFEVFDLWFAEGVQVAISKSGTVQERISGRFGRKLYPHF